MRSKLSSLLLGGLVAASVGIPAPAAMAARIPNNNASQTVPSNVRRAMDHLKSAYSSAAKAHAEVVEGRYADASNDLKAAHRDLNSAARMKGLPVGLARSIHELYARIPGVERAVNQQASSAKVATSDFVTAMNHNIENLTIASASPVGGGAGPTAKSIKVRKPIH